MCQTAGPIVKKFGTRMQIRLHVNGHSINLEKLPNHWTHRDQIWHMYTDSSGYGHGLNKLTPRAPRGIWTESGGHTFKNVGKKPNSWNDREQIWDSDTYAYSSGNGHELRSNPLIPEGHDGYGGHQFINLGKLPIPSTDRDQTWHTYTDSSGNGKMLKH